MSVRLKDIARVTGVSVKTVSNVVNGYAHVKEHTRMRVKKALDEMGYQPNLSARYLRKARVGVIALAIPDVSIPYFSEVGDAIITEAKARNYTVLLEHTGGRYEDEIQLLHGLRPHFIDGLILSPFALQYEDFLQRTNDIPLVLLGERSYEGANFDHVVIDNVEATKRMMRHLIACGKRRIAAIGAQVSGVGAIGASEETGRFRLHGYTEALIEAGYEVDPSLIVSVGAYHRADGADAMRRVLASGAQPDAVFCFNDVLALGAIRALH